MYKIQFLKTRTGDATLIDYQAGEYLLQRTLIDCGMGPNYAKLLGGKQLDRLVLTHAHLDHWAALSQVLEAPTAGPEVNVSGTIFSEKLMRKQGLYKKSGITLDATEVLARYTRDYDFACRNPRWIGMPDTGTIYDLNASESKKQVVVETTNHRKLHQGCIVPVISLRPFWIVLGADLEPGEWNRLYTMDRHFPRNVDVLQAPGHGRQRMKKEILRYLNPKYVVISSSASEEEVADDAEYYRSFGYQVFCLHQGDVVVSINGNTFRIKQK